MYRRSVILLLIFLGACSAPVKDYNDQIYIKSVEYKFIDELFKRHDHFDQQTIIRFSDINTDADLPDSRFKFYIPDGVDVIGSPR